MAGVSLRGIPTKCDRRRAFVYERVLALIARETVYSGSVTFSKADLAKRLGCCDRTLDRSILYLKREGLIEAEPRFTETGAQLSNAYHATEKGLEAAENLWPNRRKG